MADNFHSLITSCRVTLIRLQTIPTPTLKELLVTNFITVLVDVLNPSHKWEVSVRQPKHPKQTKTPALYKMTNEKVCRMYVVLFPESLNSSLVGAYRKGLERTLKHFIYSSDG
jgi:hypothetical protein